MIIRRVETCRGCCMAVNTIGKSNSAAYMRFFGEADVPALDRDSVVILDTQMNEKEAHLSRTNNFGKMAEVHAARNRVRQVIGAPLLPELPSRDDASLEHGNRNESLVRGG